MIERVWTMSMKRDGDTYPPFFSTMVTDTMNLKSDDKSYKIYEHALRKLTYTQFIDNILSY